MKKNTIIYISIGAVLLIAGYFGYQWYLKSKTPATIIIPPVITAHVSTASGQGIANGQTQDQVTAGQQGNNNSYGPNNQSGNSAGN